MSRPARPLAAPTSLRLREVAADAFAQGGLEGASLNGILKRVEMGKGSFYHHFADKAALHDWVTEAISADLLAEVRPPRLDTLTTESFRPELSELLDRMGRIAATRPELMDLGRMFHNSAEVTAERAIARVRSTVIAWVTDSLRTGQSLGVIRRNLPIDLLTAWTIASLTVIDQWVLTTTTPITARRAASDTALENLWQLLTGEAQPRT
jgi:AcrR family transcriptional regulator